MSIRVRLSFDQSPLGLSKNSWFLFDKTSCRVVADLEHLLQMKFDIQRNAALDLYVDGFLLPSQERIDLVRDGDLIRVEREVDKEESDAHDDTVLLTDCTKSKKHKLPKDTDNREQCQAKRHKKIAEKEKKKKKEPKLAGKQTLEENSDVGIRKRKKSHQEIPNKNKTSSKKVQPIKRTVFSSRKTPMKSDTATRKRQVSAYLFSSSTDKDSIDKYRKSNCTNKKRNIGKSSSSLYVNAHASITSPTSSSLISSPLTSSSKLRENAKYFLKQGLSISASSLSSYLTTSSDLSSEELPEDDSNSYMVALSRMTDSSHSNAGLKELDRTVASLLQNKPTESSSNDPKPANLRETRNKDTQRVVSDERQNGLQREEHRNPSTTLSKTNNKSHIRFDSDEDDTVPSVGNHQLHLLDNQSHPQHSYGVSHNVCTNGNPRYDKITTPNKGTYGSSLQTQEQSIPHKSVITNQLSESRSISDGVASKEILKDFSKAPSLCGPPRAGDRIAYKVLEMSASYTPEMSDYKEGVVFGYDPVTNEVSVELTEDSLAKPQGDGNVSRKFEIISEDEDEYEDESRPPPIVERKICVVWSSMVDPRLISS